MSIGRVPGATGIQPSIVTAKGDLIVATASGSVTNQAVGSNNQVLTADSAQADGVKWANGSAATLTTTGDLLYASAANTPARLGIGSTNQVLTVSGGVPTWATPSTGASLNAAYATVAAQESTTSTTMTDLTTSGPAVTLTTGTKALVIFGASQRSTIAGAVARMSFAVSGATTRATQTNEWTNTTFGSGTAAYDIGMNESAEAAIVVTGLTAGSNTFTAKYSAAVGDSVSFQFRKITVIDLGS